MFITTLALATSAFGCGWVRSASISHTQTRIYFRLAQGWFHFFAVNMSRQDESYSSLFILELNGAAKHMVKIALGNNNERRPICTGKFHY